MYYSMLSFYRRKQQRFGIDVNKNVGMIATIHIIQPIHPTALQKRILHVMYIGDNGASQFRIGASQKYICGMKINIIFAYEYSFA